MKAVHKSTEAIGTYDHSNTDWRASGLQYEEENDLPKAVTLYESVLKKRPLDPYVYDRLMILFRKSKLYKKELALIETGIKKFRESFRSAAQQNPSKKITSLSKSILRATGLTDKKGIASFHPQPIARWEKRKNTVKAKIQSAK